MRPCPVDSPLAFMVAFTVVWSAASAVGCVAAVAAGRLRAARLLLLSFVVSVVVFSVWILLVGILS